MDIENKIESLWNEASKDMSAGNFQHGAELYKEVILLLKKLGENPPAGISNAAIQKNLANAYSDFASCILEFCGMEVNPAVHALIEAIECGSRDKAILKNFLYCMSIVNGYLHVAIKTLPSSQENQRLAQLHNKGCDFLKTPDASGTPGRNWDAAIKCFQEAIQIEPESAISWFGLGLAYVGAKRDVDAINAWLKVKSIEPDYNFQVRYLLTCDE